LRRLSRLRYTLEAALIGLFFIQALRYLVGALYSRIASASIYPAIDLSLLDPVNPPPGLVDPSVISSEIMLLVYMLALPLLTVLLGRIRGLILFAAITAAFGRALMLVVPEVTPAAAAAITVGGGLFYLAMLIRHRAPQVPYFFVLGIGIDQIYRAFGHTFDPSWSASYAGVQIALSVIVMLLALINLVRPIVMEPDEELRSLMPFWSGLGLGALLYLELSLLALPNAVAGRSGTDYTRIAPFLLIATLLPLIPWVRQRARGFIALFDSALRGWSWMLLVALLIVLGTRLSGVIAGAALVLAQFSVSMMWWWLTRPQGERERNASGLWLVFSVLVFAVLVVFDMFTYEYAYVRDLAAPFTFLNDYVPPLLRGFRGMGLGLLLLAVFIGALPMIQMQRRIPWRGGTAVESLVMVLMVGMAAVLVTVFTRPPVIEPLREAETVRVGTYNIHAGYNEFFHFDLEQIALAIQRSGSNLVLLQEVEAGRMTSFGVDQTLWLARRLRMDRRFYPTNEGLQGLAVLSAIPIVDDEGRLLTSVGNQTGVQRVRVQLENGQITAYNTWLGLLLEGIGDRPVTQQEQDQQRQLTELLNIISLDHPTGALGNMIVGGTFNNVPDSDLIDRMRNTPFVDPFEDIPLNQAATLWQTGRRARLDYLWTNMLVLGTNVDPSNASDHRLAFIEVVVP
jgi:endonuclease/exonuclease/phosphatase family metal-dependent hydrolase